MKTKTSLIYLAVVGIIALVYVVALSLMKLQDLKTGIITVLIFISLLTGYVVLMRRGSRFTPDERTRKLWTRAQNLSWVITWFGVCVLIFLSQFKLLSLTYSQLLIILALFMPYSAGLIRLVLGRFGEKPE